MVRGAAKNRYEIRVDRIKSASTRRSDPRQPRQREGIASAERHALAEPDRHGGQQGQRTILSHKAAAQPPRAPGHECERGDVSSTHACAPSESAARRHEHPAIADLLARIGAVGNRRAFALADVGSVPAHGQGHAEDDLALHADAVPEIVRRAKARVVLDPLVRMILSISKSGCAGVSAAHQARG